MTILFKKVMLIILMYMPVLCVQSATIILTSDQQLNDLLDPDKEIDMSTGHQKRIMTRVLKYSIFILMKCIFSRTGTTSVITTMDNWPFGTIPVH